MDSNSSGDSFEEVENEGSLSPSGTQSPVIDRNPSPPPDTADGEEEQYVDAIGDTVYSKHWLFSTLTRLIQIISEYSEDDSDGQMQLSDNDEDDLCRVWDMAMDKNVASFLQEFKAENILLGVIAKSRCPRLTEICVGILGNIACFPETCLTLSQNEDLGAVLLLVLGDTDPPTLLETNRLLVTCLSQKNVSLLWLHRIREASSVCSNLCFIMRSSTNMDLLLKVGELVEKLFDLDEQLMKSWLTVQPSEEENENCLDVVSSLLEAAMQLRSESPDGLEVYLHVFQLLTTVDEGIQIFSASESGKAVWDFVCEVLCEDLCQPNELSLVLQEQKGILVQAFAVLQALYICQAQWLSRSDTSVILIGTVLRVLQSLSDCTIKDEQLQILAEVTDEFLADICCHISKDVVAELVKKGHLTEKTCLTAVDSLLPKFKSSFQHLESVLSETDPELADVMKKKFPV
ncbi:protein saal1 [Thalassophryne amazonica]|uniref:protein saal1 n=1 Tax=Thalassophryne amazonica TaxID=390379 RepID=UPI00147158BB|nr:protein saal1 [Thalassophryne amazonica]